MKTDPNASMVHYSIGMQAHVALHRIGGVLWVVRFAPGPKEWVTVRKADDDDVAYIREADSSPGCCGTADQGSAGHSAKEE